MSASSRTRANKNRRIGLRGAALVLAAGVFATTGVAAQTPAPTAKAPALMPGYPIAVSILVQLFTAQLWEPRLISLVAALATAGLAAMIVRLETLNWTVAVSSCGFVLRWSAMVAASCGSRR